MIAAGSRLPLFWRVFAGYVAVLLLTFGLLVVAPVTVSAPVALTEVVVLVAGLLAMLALALVLLRSAFRPLRLVTSTMERIDPLNPGERVPVVGEPDVSALARAFNEMLDRLEHERRESARQALRGQEAERRRIARELHDEVGQIFTAIMLQIESCAALAGPALREELHELRETARAGAVDVRRIAARLRPEALEDLGLHSALQALTSAFAEQTAVTIDRDIGDVGPLSTDQELVVYRIAQEALTNVARHAGASAVHVTLGEEEGTWLLRVSDDGRGLAAGATDSTSGIRGMRERAMLIGAQLTLGPGEAGGTAVELRIPAATR